MLTTEQVERLRSEPLEGPNKLRRAKELARTTQMEIASALRCEQSYISRIERGAYSKIPLENARALADYFGCQIEDLFPKRESAVAS